MSEVPIYEDETDLDNYDNYGQTPPRTRILRKNKERTQRDFDGASKTTPKMMRPDKKTISRRNTVTIMFDQLVANADSSENSSDPNKRSDKRSLKLQRGSERDLKLDLSLAQNYTPSDNKENDVPPATPQPSVQVESSKQFKSLCSKRVAPNRRQVRSVSGSFATGDLAFIAACPSSRVEFHKTLSMLIKMGSTEKPSNERPTRRHASKEEQLFQTEFKDLLWLELQAWHADRSMTDEDNYICIARECIGLLLNEIMIYKFRRRKQKLSVTGSNDSGVVIDDCSGCLSMFCTACLESQNDALREVEELMQRLEKVEGLFMSSKAFAEIYPLYTSTEFVGRVKAMCLWYNMMRHQRLKLAILGRLLSFLENRYYQWPATVSYDGCSADSNSPSDSNSSNSSVDYLIEKGPIDIYANHFVNINRSYDGKTSPYRKYIENVLKTRGLNKSMHFLERLHSDILAKAQITLERPQDMSIFSRMVTEDEQDLELLRYGCFSPEAQQLALPSYKAVFLFLSTVPLKVIHEFLQMRLEQKPKNPSPLSIRQLMRELKEGIRMATKHRERIIMNYHVALQNTTKHDKDFYSNSLDSFDDTLKAVFTDYLEYLEEWALLEHENFQKNLLEDEWKFTLDIVPSILGPNCEPVGWYMASEKITSIICKLMQGIRERLEDYVAELEAEIRKEDDDVNQKNALFAICRDMQCLFKKEREMCNKTIAFCRSVFKNRKLDFRATLMDDFKQSYASLKCSIATAIENIQNLCDTISMDYLDEIEKTTLASRYRESLLQGYQFGFEFYKEMSDFVPKEGREKVARSMIQFARLWMKFTRERCERGRGKRPRWAYQGLDFLLTVCEPQNTRYLTEEEFEDLKTNMDSCISHVIGSLTPEPQISPKYFEFTRTFSRGSRGPSPSPRPAFKTQRSSGRKINMERAPTPSSDSTDSTTPQMLRKFESLSEGVEKANKKSRRRQDRVFAAISNLETDIDKKLREAELIGFVITCPKESKTSHIRRKHVTFTWQRGIKVGQGRFGKVYTAVNNSTGEMMAMKEIAIQPNDAYTIRNTTEEIKILEGINHRNIVKYYGLEIHKEEMLIFMEFCPEGTLESLVAGMENGLPEVLIRKYTYQLVSGVAVLHEHGIVHRDIKTANIFLADEGNCLKIGDFGCAVKIKSHTTMPGELKGFIGTQAYMAPEMFMSTGSVEGHGRAADIWSVGCVVVELATGKRPWAQFDSNYQIMFRVGTGDRPEAPASLIEEGHDFLNRCLQHDPRDRATAHELLQHNFVKIGEDDS